MIRPKRGGAAEAAPLLFLFATLSLLVASQGLLTSATAPPRYFNALTLGTGTEWRFRPLVLDVSGDGHPDLVATARLASHSLWLWLGDGKGNLGATKPTWTDTGYASLASGDVNGDGPPDIVSASHFARVQTLLNNGKTGLSEKVLLRTDGYVGARLADLDRDGDLDLVLLGYQKAGLEIHLGDGTGNWKFHRTLPDPKPGPVMAGRDLFVGDLNRDGHVDVVAAFQQGIYIYYGDGHGGFIGGATTLRSQLDIPESLVVGDVNHDGYADIAVNGGVGGRERLSGPDVLLGDGRGGWIASSMGLKVMKYPSVGIELADLNRDGNVDLIAAGNITGAIGDGYGLFWFAGDGKGGWQLVQESGLPATGLPVIHGVTAADLDHDKALEIIALGGGRNGQISIWKRR